MPTYYCDNYEVITGKKPGDDETPEPETTPAPEVETKVVWPESPAVETK